MGVMGILWGILAVLWAFVVIVSIADIVRRHLGMGRGAAWILLIVLFPFAGALLYWAMRKTPQDELDRSAAAERDLRESGRPPTRLGA
jgi:hypothetical protein